MLGKIEGRRRRGPSSSPHPSQQRMRWLNGIIDSMDMILSRVMMRAGDGQGNLACCSSWDCKEMSN